MLTGDRTVGFHISADVDFEHKRHPRSISGELSHIHYCKISALTGATKAAHNQT